MAQGKRFSPEFRQEAVRLYRVSERPYRAVAEELAVAGSRASTTAAASTQHWDSEAHKGTKR